MSEPKGVIANLLDDLPVGQPISAEVTTDSLVFEKGSIVEICCKPHPRSDGFSEAGFLRYYVTGFVEQTKSTETRIAPYESIISNYKPISTEDDQFLNNLFAGGL